MKMNKQRLSHSGGLHPLEKTFQMVSTPGSEPGPNLFDIWVLPPLRHPCQRGYVRT